MNKIITSLLTISVLSAVVIGGTMSFFSDKETSIGNTFTAGTIDIAVDGQNPWQGTFDWEDIKPGKEFEMSFEITNVGENPLKLWKIIKCMQYDDNGIIEPEQEWYDENDVVEKNDLDSAIVYEMEVDGQMVVSREAGITMDQIKNNYIGLVKFDIGLTTPQYGILEVGESVLVTQRYFMKLDTENWAQSDQMTFVIEIEARQVSAPEPLQQISFMENKEVPGDWHAISDTRMGILKYDYMAPEFNYDFTGVGLNANKEYCLIYAKDPWGAAKPLIDSGTTDEKGVLDLAGSKNLGDLPYFDDDNYLNGAKIWLLPCDEYTGSIGWPPYDDWLFDNWPGLINYRQGDRPSGEINCEYDDENGDDNPNCTDDDGDGYFVETSGCGNEPGFLGHSDCDDNNASINPDATEICDDGLDNDCDGNIDCIDNDCDGDAACTGAQTIFFSDLGADPQYGYVHDYSNANVNFTYITPSDNTLSGVITATGLKPYATYQMKFNGKPVCLYGTGGDDTLNDYIGSIGRWWNNDTNQNVDDAYKSSHPGECITGYLVWDDLTADASGNVVKTIETANSYHVFWCNDTSCDTVHSNTQLYHPDSSYPLVPFCPSGNVNGQIERFTCGGLNLDSRSYDLQFVLNEECFHQGGAWTAVMDADISFVIN